MPRLIGTILNAAGEPVQTAVVFDLLGGPLKVNGYVISAGRKTVATDADGQFAVDLESAQYSVTWTIGAVTSTDRIYLPDTDPEYDLSALIAGNPPENLDQWVAEARIALLAAERAVAAAAAFPIDKFRGTITALGTDPGLPATYTGFWWQINVTGTLSHGNAGGIVATAGDRILCNGTSWVLYAQPASYIPDESLFGRKLIAQSVDATRFKPEVAAWIGTQSDSNLWLWRIGTSGGKGLIGFRKTNGACQVLLASDVAQTIDSLGAGSGQFRIGSSDSMVFEIVSPTNKRLFGLSRVNGDITGNFVVAEVVAARGTLANLDARLSKTLLASGIPRRSRHQDDLLALYHQTLQGIAMGDTSTAGIAFIGDSWAALVMTEISRLRTAYSHGGAGYTPFGFASVYTSPIGFAVTGDGTITLTSAWVANDADPYSPDTRSISTSTAGQTVTATVNASAPAVTLFYELQGGGGTFRYRFGAGAWSGNISTSGTAGVASLALTGVPASGGYTLTVETVSGSVILCGAQFRTTKGVRLDRIAWGGARASHYAAANATAWQTSLTAIAPKLVIIQLGTNDAAAYDAATFAGHIGTLITRIRTALPAADLLLVAVAERTDTPVHAMSDFAAALATIADSEQCGFVDLQRAFGDPADYVLGGPTNLFENTTHPNQDGYRRIGSVLVPIIESL